MSAVTLNGVVLLSLAIMLSHAVGIALKALCTVHQIVANTSIMFIVGNMTQVKHVICRENINNSSMQSLWSNCFFLCCCRRTMPIFVAQADICH